MSQDELLQRLAAAERVCVLVGITGASGTTDRDKAKTQAWMEWHRAYGTLAADISDDEILHLAARRDVIRDNTIVRLRQETRERLKEEVKGTLLEAMYERQHEPEVYAAHRWGEWTAVAGFPDYEHCDCDGHCQRVQTRFVGGGA